MFQRMKKWTALSIFALLVPFTFATAWQLPQVPDCSRIDIGPAYVHMDILTSGVTTHEVDMGALRVDSTFVFFGGLTLKPTLMLGCGKGIDRIYTGTIGLGYTLPCSKTFVFTPLVGVGYSYFATRFDFRGLPNLQQTYKSISPFVGIDASYTFTPGWRIGANVQYGWARTKTDIGTFIHNHRSESEGFSYGVALEKDLSKTSSVNIGAGYNNTLSKERHGLRGYGVKVGYVFWF